VITPTSYHIQSWSPPDDWQFVSDFRFATEEETRAYVEQHLLPSNPHILRTRMVVEGLPANARWDGQCVEEL
jgi:hypothetical protein